LHSRIISITPRCAVRFTTLTPVSPAAGHRESLIEEQPLELPLHEIHALPRSPVETVLAELVKKKFTSSFFLLTPSLSCCSQAQVQSNKIAVLNRKYQAKSLEILSF